MHQTIVDKQDDASHQMTRRRSAQDKTIQYTKVTPLRTPCTIRVNYLADNALNIWQESTAASNASRGVCTKRKHVTGDCHTQGGE